MRTVKELRSRANEIYENCPLAQAIPQDGEDYSVGLERLRATHVQMTAEICERLERLIELEEARANPNDIGAVMDAMPEHLKPDGSHEWKGGSKREA